MCLCVVQSFDICCDMKLGVMQGFKCVHMCGFCLLWFEKVGGVIYNFVCVAQWTTCVMANSLAHPFH